MNLPAHKITALLLTATLALGGVAQCSKGGEDNSWLLLVLLLQSGAAAPGEAPADNEAPGEGEPNAGELPETEGDSCLASGGIGYSLAGECVHAGYTLAASRDRSGAAVNPSCDQPSGQFCEDGVAYFENQAVTIPATFPVTSGAPGNHSARFEWDNVRCIYGGNGRSSSGGTAFDSSVVGGSIGTFSDGTAQVKGYCYELDAGGAVTQQYRIPSGETRSIRAIYLRVNNGAGGQLTAIAYDPGV